MMKTLIASTAVLALMTTPAFADDHQHSVEMTVEAAVTSYTDNHDWVGKPVYDSNWDKVGEVERVRLDDQGFVGSMVVETGGFLDIGGKEIEIAMEQYSLVTAEGDEGEAEIQLGMTGEAFKAMPAFDEDKATDYPLADNDLFDGYEESEGEADLDVEAGLTLK